MPCAEARPTGHPPLRPATSRHGPPPAPVPLRYHSVIPRDEAGFTRLDDRRLDTPDDGAERSEP